MTSSVSAMTISKTSSRSAAIARISDLVERSRRVLVVSHIDPDGDALGSQLAFGEYLRLQGKDVFLLRDSDIPDKYAFLPGIEKVIKAESLADDFAVDTAVILECPNQQRVGSAMRFITDGVAVINIDHHPDARELGTVNWFETAASSVGEMLTEFFEATGADITPTMATCLYTAIVTDTGRFRFPATTERTMAIGGKLIRLGADPQAICDNVYYNMRPSTLRLTGRVLHEIEFHYDNRVCFLHLTDQMLKETGAESAESDGMVDYTMYSGTVRAGALFKETDGGATKVSMRSRDAIDVSAIAASFGGGGHRNAAGCRVEGDLAHAKSIILEKLQEAIDAERI